MFPQQQQPPQSQQPFGRGLPPNGMGIDSYINAPRPAANYQSLGKLFNNALCTRTKNLLNFS